MHCTRYNVCDRPPHNQGERGGTTMVLTMRILLLLALHTPAAGPARATAVAELATGMARAHAAETREEDRTLS